MGVCKGTVFSERPIDGDKIDFSAIIRLGCPPHWPEEVRVAEALQIFRARYYYAMKAALNFELMFLRCECEEVSERDDDPIND